MNYELVKVLDRSHLLNAAQLRCPYTTRDRHGLARGIHVVLRADAAGSGTYDAGLSYHGPFPSWTAAGEFARSAAAVLHAGATTAAGSAVAPAAPAAPTAAAADRRRPSSWRWKLTF